jgi:hypothetical protein
VDEEVERAEMEAATALDAVAKLGEAVQVSESMAGEDSRPFSSDEWADSSDTDTDSDDAETLVPPALVPPAPDSPLALSEAGPVEDWAVDEERDEALEGFKAVDPSLFSTAD